LNCTSGATPHIRSSSTRRGTRLVDFCFLYLNLFELCVRYCCTTRSRSSRRSARYLFIYLFYLFLINHLNCAWGTAPQQEVAVPNGHQTFFQYMYCILLKIVLQVPLHSKESHRQTAHQTLFLICFTLFEWCIRCRSTTRCRRTRRGNGLLFLKMCIRCRFTTKIRGTRARMFSFWMISIFKYILNCASRATSQ